MTRTIAMLKDVPLACVFALVMVAATGCYGEVGDDGPAYYPSAAYVATASPVYYEGRPAYWYGNRWYYRDGGGWGHYRSEPRYLNQYRVRAGVRVGGPGRMYERRR
jgi:hypothetical protein